MGLKNAFHSSDTLISEDGICHLVVTKNKQYFARSSILTRRRVHTSVVYVASISE